MKLIDLLDGLKTIRVSGSADRAIRGLAYDSRKVSEGTLFCTWKGEARDGHDFVPEALARGASALVVEQPVARGGATAVEVESGRRALALLAAKWFSNPSRQMSVVGVTGTNGKTSVAWILRSLLVQNGWPTGLLGTVEYDVGRGGIPAHRTTPEGLELQEYLAAMLENGCRAAAMEVSSHALALHRTAGTRFHTAVFTNLTQDHLDFHGTMEAYFKAKALLFSELESGSHAVINIDDPYGLRFAATVPTGVTLWTYGEGISARCRISGIEVTARGSTFMLSADGAGYRCETPLIGSFNVHNVVASMVAARTLGLEWESIIRTLQTVKPVPGRMETVPHAGDFSVVVDYAHTPDAVGQTLKVLRHLTRGSLRVVVGCGGDRDRTKRPLMAQAGELFADELVLTSDNPRSEDPLKILAEMSAGVSRPEAVRVIPDRAEAITSTIQSAEAGDVVVLLGKGHEDYQEIGGQRYPFSDREVARAALERRIA